MQICQCFVLFVEEKQSSLIVSVKSTRKKRFQDLKEKVSNRIVLHNYQNLILGGGSTIFRRKLSFGEAPPPPQQMVPKWKIYKIKISLSLMRRIFRTVPYWWNLRPSLPLHVRSDPKNWNPKIEHQSFINAVLVCAIYEI